MVVLAFAHACLLLPLVESCQTDEDCNLNGFCKNSTCECISVWMGSKCGQLNFASAASQNHGALIPSANTSRWCAGSIPDSTGTWHLYSALMDLNCGLNSWQRNSAISHATSKSPTGPFGNETIIHPYFSHNPKPIRAPDGTYLIFHIGCGDGKSNPIVTCTNGTTPTTGGPQSPSAPPAEPFEAGGDPISCGGPFTSILFADNPNGPWNVINAIGPSPNASVPFPRSVDNPSPFFFPNGSVLVMFRSYTRQFPLYHSVIGIARASSWRGPYTIDEKPAFMLFQEDPFLWFQPETQSFHALFHNMGGCTDMGCHAFSKDSVHWTLSLQPAYSSTVQFDNGQTLKMKRRERPQLVFDPVSGRPTHLINGVQPPQSDGGQEDKTYSLIVPLVYKPVL